MSEQYNTLADALNAKTEEAAKIQAGMVQAGVSAFQSAMVGKALTPIFHSIMLARVTQTDPAEVEDGFINIFCMGVSEMMAVRAIPTHEAAIALAQEMINELSKLLADQIADQYTPDVIVPAPGDRH